MADITISVALVTRNRPDSLRRCLGSLRKQKVQPSEIVVSDDSDDASERATRDVAVEFDCRYIRGPQRGLYANRNHVAAHCSGTHVRTMDDDHEFPDGHCAMVAAAVESDPAAVWTIGEYYSWAEAHLPGPCCGEIQPRGFSAPPIDLNHSMAISDGASVYPRSVFSKHQMLDQFLFGKSYLEFGARLKAFGYRLRHLPDTYIIHHMQEMGRSYQAEALDVQTGFLAAALAYGVYFPNWLKKTECWSYFTLLALKNTLLKKTAFGLSEWQTSFAAYQKQKEAFLSPKVIE